MSSMFCYQCEQTARCTGCTTFGVCGKDPDTSAMIDLLIHVTKGLGQYAHRARKNGAVDDSVNLATAEALFTTVTNVNFDPARLAGVVRQTVAARDKAKKLYEDASRNPEQLSGPAVFQVADDLNGMIAQGLEVGIEKRMSEQGEDVTGLQELLTYGLKGAAAYMDHAHILGRESEEAYAFFHKALNALAEGESDIDTLLGLNLECGKANLAAMEVLDGANTGTYGHPEPTPVRITRRQGHQHLYPRRDAPLPRIPRPEKVPPPGGQLRRGLAGPARGVRGVPRGHPHDHQLHTEAQRELQGPDIHHRPCGLARSGTRRRF